MTNQETIAKIHKWEAAGLGKGPFRCIGCEEKTYQACQGAPIQPGGSCDYCGMGIRYCFTILSADGKRFKVGSSCVLKTNAKGSVIADHVKREAARMARAAAAEIKAEKMELAKLIAIEKLQGKREALSAMPHPRASEGGYWADQSYADQIDWMMDNAGDARIISEIGKALKKLSDQP